jgi:uncharacterized membrane protein (DUF2068 family)
VDPDPQTPPPGAGFELFPGFGFILRSNRGMYRTLVPDSIHKQAAGISIMKKTRASLRVIAGFEAFEGFLALAAASGLLLLLHQDLEDLAIQLFEHAHLNPAAHYPNIFITALDNLANTQFILIALGAIVYALFRFVEAYGLFHEATWAEVLAVFSSAIYVPLEVMELIRAVNVISAGVLTLNLAIVAVAAVALWQKRRVKGKVEA